MYLANGNSVYFYGASKGLYKGSNKFKYLIELCCMGGCTVEPSEAVVSVQRYGT